jgi:hypothetical protein
LTTARRLRLGAVAISAAGLVAAAALMYFSGLALQQTVEGFARAPVGCTTTLEFDTTDTFTFYIETKGQTGEVGGDCAGSGASYDHGAGSLPQLTLTLEDAAGAAVPLGEGSGYRYNTGQFIGSALATAAVRPGSYRLTVASDSSDVAVAVGRDPEVESAVLRAIAGAVALLAVLVGAALLVLSVRRKPASPPPPANDDLWRPRLMVAPTPPPPQRPTLMGPSAAPWAPPQLPGSQPRATLPPPTGWSEPPA